MEDNQTTFLKILMLYTGTYEGISNGVKIIKYWNLNENLSNKFEKFDLNEPNKK